jgi:hypothetical protein
MADQEVAGAMVAALAGLETQEDIRRQKEMRAAQEPERHLITAPEAVALGRLVKEVRLVLAETGATERHPLSRVHQLPEPVAAEAAAAATLGREALEGVVMGQQGQAHQEPKTPEAGVEVA